MNFNLHCIICLLILVSNCTFLYGWSVFKAAEPARQYMPSTITLMLDPAGDAKHAGRIIEDSFERGISLQYAQEIKYELQSIIPHIRTILTRSAGESVEPLQNASFANRLKADFYLSIHFYQTTESFPQVAIYQLVQNPVTDFWERKQENLMFYVYDQAHRINIHKTQTYGISMLDLLKKLEKTNHYQCLGFFHIPFKPLLGIIAPALALEIGIHKKEDWKKLLSPLVKALAEVISTIRSESTHEATPVSSPIA